MSVERNNGVRELGNPRRCMRSFRVINNIHQVRVPVATTWVLMGNERFLPYISLTFFRGGEHGSGRVVRVSFSSIFVSSADLSFIYFSSKTNNPTTEHKWLERERTAEMGLVLKKIKVKV